MSSKPYTIGANELMALTPNCVASIVPLQSNLRQQVQRLLRPDAGPVTMACIKTDDNRFMYVADRGARDRGCQAHKLFPGTNMHGTVVMLREAQYRALAE